MLHAPGVGKALRPMLRWRWVHNLLLALYSAFVTCAMVAKLRRHNRFASTHALLCLSLIHI